MIVFLCNESPWPVRSGGRVRMDGLIGALRRDHEVQVLVARRHGTDEVGPEAVALPPSNRSKLGTLAGPGPRLGRGLLEPAHHPFLVRQCAGADAVVVSQSYLAAELPQLPAPVVVDFQNLETQRQASIGGLVGRAEALKAARWEPRVAGRAAGAVCVDEADADVVRRWGARQVVVVPNVAAVPVSLPSPVVGTVLAVGDWRYGPNAQGLAWLAREVLPLLDGKVVLAGRGSEAYGGLGFVDDVTPLYDDAAVVVGPVARGAGTQLKVVEALTRGRVVVTTAYGARSVPPAAAAGCIVADGPVAMVHEIALLVGDPVERHRREALLRQAAIPRTWDAAAAPLRAMLAEVLGG